MKIMVIKGRVLRTRLFGCYVDRPLRDASEALSLNASIMLISLAMPVPAMSKAVP